MILDYLRGMGAVIPWRVEGAMQELPLDIEAAIESCVEDFHVRAYGDPVLARLFGRGVTNLPEHLRGVADFWCQVLLDSGSHPSSPYAAHVDLPLGPEHFDRWMSCFRESAERTLPKGLAAAAVAKAEQVIAELRLRRGVA
jgi:hemoglobin